MNSLRTLWGQNNSLFKYTSADPLFDLSQHTNSTSQLSFTSKRVSSACGTFSRKVELYTTRNLSKSSVVFRSLFFNSHYHPFRLRGQKSHVRIFPSRGYFVKFGLFNNCFCFSLLSHMYCLPYICVDGITILQLVRFLLQYEKL